MRKMYALLLSLIMYSAFGQDGSLEPSTVFNYGSTSTAKKICKDPDGNYIVLTENNNIVKIGPGGNVLFTITLPAGIYNVIYGQSNGGILVSGDIVNYNYLGQTYNWILRYTSTGAFDPNFKCNFLSGGYGRFAPTTISEQPTEPNKLLIGGRKTVSDTGIKLLYRINSNTGIVDAQFNPFPLESDLQMGMHVSTISTYLNGSMIVGGKFSTYNNAPAGNVIKLYANGGHDPSYGVTGITVSSSAILSSSIQPDGKVLLGGSFTHTPTGKKGLIRTSSTGIVETGFGLNFNPAPVVKDIKIECNLNILICGEFDKGIIRLNSNGNLDGNFNNNIGADKSNINSMAVSGSTGIYIAGNFTNYNNTPTLKSIARLKGSQINNIIVTNNVFNVVQNGSANTKNILSTASYNGNSATIANVNITASLNNPVITGIDINLNTGVITVNPVTQAGTYTFTYTLCPKVGCGVCKTVTITINVTASSIDAVDDTKSVNYGTALIFNVLENDRENGVLIPPDSKTVKYISQPIEYIITNKNGTITIPAGTPAGTYYLTYELCILGIPMVCDIATITVTVIGQIVAKNDDFATNCMNGITGGTSDDVTLNDTMDGTPINDNIINISIINNGGIPNLTVNAFGILSIPANTAFGTYTITYKICQKNTLSCATATAKICVNDGFDPGTGANGPIYAVALQDNGKIIIGGNFTEYDGIPRKRIARLNNDLSLDLSFDPQGIGFNDVVYALALQGDNILVGGLFTATGTGVLKNHLVRLNSNGIVDNTFVNNNFQYVGISPTPAFYIKAITLDNSGRILVGGSFGNVNSFSGTLKTKIIRLSANGNPDNTFKSILSTDSGAVHNITVLDDQTIVIGGINLKIPSKNVILYKVTSAGDLDLNFIVGQAVDVQTGLMNVTDIAKNNGKLVVVGYFNSYNNSGLSNIVQINPNGVLDGLSVFNPGISSNSVINSVAVDPSNNNLIIGGNFSSFNGNSASKIARLTVNGTFDPSFNIGIGFDPGANNSYSIFDIKLQDSKIVAGGHFTKFNGIDAKYITRLVQNSPVIQGRMNMYPEEKATKGISIYPNPSEGIFNIDFKGYDESKFDITIYNALGQLIHKGSVTPQNTNQIDLTRFEAGSYFITLQNANETINKIIVKK